MLSCCRYNPKSSCSLFYYSASMTELVRSNSTLENKGDYSVFTVDEKFENWGFSLDEALNVSVIR